MDVIDIGKDNLDITRFVYGLHNGYRLVTRLKAILGGYDVSRHILSSADIKAVNEAIWTLKG